MDDNQVGSTQSCADEIHHHFVTVPWVTGICARQPVKSPSESPLITLEALQLAAKLLV